VKEEEALMVKIKCLICGSIGFSASDDTRCECGGNCKAIFFAVNLNHFKKEKKKGENRMKYIKSFLSMVICFVMITGIAFGQAEKPVISLTDSILTATGTSVLLEEEEENLIDTRWTRERILQVLVQSGTADSNGTIAGDTDKGIVWNIIKAVKAANKLMGKYFNPDELDVTYISLDENLLTLRYALGIREVTVHVDMRTYSPFFGKYDSRLAKAAFNVRNNISLQMGLNNIGKVHINEILPVMIAYAQALNKDALTISRSWYPYYNQFICGFSARVGNYTLGLEYREYTYIYPWYYKATQYRNSSMISIWPVNLVNTVTLNSFVDNRTGIDYVKEAKKDLLALFNPEYSNMGVGYWSMKDGILWLNINLSKTRYDYSRGIAVEVNLTTGTVNIDKTVVDAVKRARYQTYKRLQSSGITYDDVHINAFSALYRYVIEVVDGIARCTFRIDYKLSVSTPKFNLTYTYSNGNLTLTSLISRETGCNLLKNATYYLRKVINPTDFKLSDWNMAGDYIVFHFKLTDGSIVSVNVNVNTGETTIYKKLVDAVMKTRNDIAKKTGKDLSQIHIDSIKYYYYICYAENRDIDEGIGVDVIYPYPYPREIRYGFTASVDNYTLTLEYREYTYSYPWYRDYKYEEDGTIGIKPIWYPQTWTTITLTSFVDNHTGIDYVKKAQDEVLNLFNPDNHDIGVGYWSMDGGLLKLNINLFHSGKYPFYVMRIGTIVPVEVDLETGKISIDQRLVDAVNESREKTSEKLGIDYGDTHVNGIYLEYPLYILHVYPPEPVEPKAYIVFVSTEEFDLTLRYDFKTESLELTRLKNNETGVDLVHSTKDYLAEKFNLEYGAIHVNNFSLEQSIDGTGSMILNINVDGRDEIYICYVNPDTGQVLMVLIGIPLFDELILVDITNEERAVDDLIARINEFESEKEDLLHLNEELLQRLALQEQIQAQAADGIFDPHMADEDDILNQE